MPTAPQRTDPAGTNAGGVSHGTPLEVLKLRKNPRGKPLTFLLRIFPSLAGDVRPLRLVPGLATG
jgi:hypothetical protein